MRAPHTALLPVIGRCSSRRFLTLPFVPKAGIEALRRTRVDCRDSYVSSESTEGMATEPVTRRIIGIRVPFPYPRGIDKKPLNRKTVNDSCRIGILPVGLTGNAGETRIGWRPIPRFIQSCRARLRRAARCI
jgi:hypothetical protein